MKNKNNLTKMVEGIHCPIHQIEFERKELFYFIECVFRAHLTFNTICIIPFDLVD